MRNNHCRMLSLLAIFLMTAQAAVAQEAPAKDSTVLDLSYRKVAKSDYNGSVFVVKGEDLMTSATTFLTEDLMGIVPGLMLRQSESGLESGNASYWIRGQRSPNNGVLVLVDGLERAFATLTAEEIESIQVLKDAAATGIYGMRAANGALLITTKKGISGKPKVDFAAQLILEDPIDSYEPLSSAGYAKHYNIAQLYDGLNPTYSEYDIFNYQQGTEGYADVAWRNKYFKKNWLLQRYNVNIKGGMKNATYFVNFGYLHQPGMFNTEKDLGYDTNNNADRYNYRSNITVDVTSSTHLNVDLYGWFKRENMPNTAATTLYNLLCKTPANAFPEYYWFKEGDTDQDGNLITPMGDKLVAGSTYNTNPWAYMNRSGYSRSMKMYGSLSAQLRQDLDVITPGLYAKLNFSLDSQTNSTIQRTRGYAYYTPIVDGLYQKTGNDGNLSNTVEGKSGNRYLTISGQIGYDRSFGRNNISAAASYEQFESSADNGVPNRYQSIYGYASYNYDHRYGIDVTGIYQGWYGFAPGHKFGFFPTVSAGWTISNEKFLKESKAINFLKLRASYGQIGNSRGVDQFTYKSQIKNVGSIFVTAQAMGTNLAGYYESNIANTSLTWENVRQLNVGLDASLFGDRLYFNFDWWKDNRDKSYTANNRISTLLGLNSEVSISSNIGATESSGWEIGGGLRDKIGKFGYRLGGTFTYAKNTLLKNGSLDEQFYYVSPIGFSHGRKLGYVVEGIFQSYEQIAAHATQNWSEVKPGDIMYKDINSDGVIDTNDRVPIGYNNIPEIFYGFNLGLSYGPVSLNLLFQGAAHVSHSLTEIDFEPFTSYTTIYSHQTQYWTPETPQYMLPRTTLGASSANNTQSSDLFVCDADYLRLKRVELAYNFKGGSCIYVSGYNLFTWSDYPYGDPEYSNGLSNIPVTRNISLGGRITF
ncbi:MAG: SusC/RagA family TonB-linked outer membrane protein [Bacteroidales bacterium]|nr:SusC/RagA family TonB-linked outer membrane protein [Bacteroidales bacterium]